MLSKYQSAFVSTAALAAALPSQPVALGRFLRSNKGNATVLRPNGGSPHTTPTPDAFRDEQAHGLAYFLAKDGGDIIDTRSPVTIWKEKVEGALKASDAELLRQLLFENVFFERSGLKNDPDGVDALLMKMEEKLNSTLSKEDMVNLHRQRAEAGEGFGQLRAAAKAYNIAGIRAVASAKGADYRGDEAASWFRKAIALAESDDDIFKYQNNLIPAYTSDNNPNPDLETALVEIKKAQRLNSKAWGPHNAEAHAYNRQGKFDEAWAKDRWIAEKQEKGEVNVTNVDAMHYNAALRLIAGGAKDEAIIAQFKKVTKADPRYHNYACIEIGQVLEKRKKYSAAEAIYRAGLEMKAKLEAATKKGSRYAHLWRMLENLEWRRHAQPVPDGLALKENNKRSLRLLSCPMRKKVSPDDLVIVTNAGGSNYFKKHLGLAGAIYFEKPLGGGAFKTHAFAMHEFTKKWATTKDKLHKLGLGNFVCRSKCGAAVTFGGDRNGYSVAFVPEDGIAAVEKVRREYAETDPEHAAAAKVNLGREATCLKETQVDIINTGGGNDVANVTCNVCQRTIAKGEKMHACRHCDTDVCLSCHAATHKKKPEVSRDA